MSKRREDILSYTGELIQKVGFKGFSYADLSDRLGVTKASIHHHFPTKEDLGIAYCEKKMAELLAFRARLSSLPAGFAKFDEYLAMFRSLAGAKMCGIHAMQSDVGGMSKRLTHEIRRVSETELEILAEILAEGRASQSMQFSATPYEQALLIVCALKGALLLSRVKNDDSFDRLCLALCKEIKGETGKDH